MDNVDWVAILDRLPGLLNTDKGKARLVLMRARPEERTAYLSGDPEVAAATIAELLREGVAAGPGSGSTAAGGVVAGPGSGSTAAGGRPHGGIFKATGPWVAVGVGVPVLLMAGNVGLLAGNVGEGVMVAKVFVEKYDPTLKTVVSGIKGVTATSRGVASVVAAASAAVLVLKRLVVRLGRPNLSSTEDDEQRPPREDASGHTADLAPASAPEAVT